MNPKLCDRCKKILTSSSMSYFNEDICCNECLDKEKAHPKYAEAKRAENEQVKRGNYNFPGIGLPEDLK